MRREKKVPSKGSLFNLIYAPGNVSSSICTRRALVASSTMSFTNQSSLVDEKKTNFSWEKFPCLGKKFTGNDKSSENSTCKWWCEWVDDESRLFNKKIFFLFLKNWKYFSSVITCSQPKPAYTLCLCLPNQNPCKLSRADTNFATSRNSPCTSVQWRDQRLTTAFDERKKCFLENQKHFLCVTSYTDI